MKPELSPKIILVLGMHRSGTSLIAQLIAKWGAFMGDDLMPANEYNQDGYWEYNPLVNFHNKLLEKTHNKWYAPSEKIDQEKLLFEFGDEARQLVRNMDRGGDIWCWKDPRMVLFLEFWKEILKEREIIYIISNRHPEDVANSLFIRDKMPVSVALTLWEFYLSKIFEAFSGRSSYLFFDYNKTVVEPNECCEELFNYLNKSFQLAKGQKFYHAMVQSVNKSLNHAKSGLMPSLSPNQVKLYRIANQGQIPNDFKISENQFWYFRTIFSLYKNAIGKNIYTFHYAQLFYKDKFEDYNEELSLVTEVRENTKTVSFKFDRLIHARQLRFDPFSDYAQIRIHHIQLFNLSKLLDIRMTLTSNSFLVENQDYLFDTNDPQIVIDFEQTITLDEVIIEVEYLKVGKNAIPLILVHQQQNMEQQQGDIIALSKRINAFELEHLSLRTELDNKNKALILLEMQLDSQLNKTELLDRRLQSLEVIINEKNEQISALQHQSKELNNEIQARKDLNHEFELQIVKLTDSKKELENVKSSLAFKLLSVMMIPFEKARSIWFIRLIKMRLNYNRDIRLIKNSEFFDKDYYLQNNPDVAASGMSAVRHYLLFGGFEGRKPSEKFDSFSYLEQFPDVKENGMNPLVHYLKYGITECRNIFPEKSNISSSVLKNLKSETSESGQVGKKIIERFKGFQDVQVIRNSEYFDSEYYLNMNPDLKLANVEPAEHYLFHGWKEGRNPSELFNTDFYLNKYEDVKQSKMNPLIHYIKYGESENRHCSEKTGNDYLLWIKKYDTLSPCDIEEMKRSISLFHAKPLISLVMPVFNPNPAWLKEAINSVINQIYPFWELCIADDCSSDKEIIEILEYYQITDARIKVTYRASNGHISAASNSALALATGEFVALLDHDDILPIHALFWVANAINQNPGIKLIYSDEDKIDENGVCQNPYFKCDWNPELFYSQNMISHLGVYQTEMVRTIGGFRTGFEGSQDYDLALRFIENIDPKQIFHIPKVLYHWRLHNNSTSSSGNCKDYAFVSGEKAINEHLVRTKRKAVVSIIQPGLYRLNYQLPKFEPHITLITPTKNQSYLLRRCIQSVLEKTKYTAFDIIIINNGSDEPELFQYLYELRTDKRVTCIEDNRPFNYSALNNMAVATAKGEYVCLLNNDTEVISPDWLGEMVAIAVQPGIGAVGAKLYYPDDIIQHAGVILGIGGVAGHINRFLPSKSYGYFGRAVLMQEMSAVTGACLVVKKTNYLEVGGMDELNLPVAFNDVDFCLRLKKAGYRNIWTPYAELYHHESVTRGKDVTETNSHRFNKEIAYMKEIWGNELHYDPAYNPNLSLTGENFELAWPPRNIFFNDIKCL